MPHSKAFGMRNLQYEIEICQKSHNSRNDGLFLLRIFMDQTLVAFQQIRH